MTTATEPAYAVIVHADTWSKSVQIVIPGVKSDCGVYSGIAKEQLRAVAYRGWLRVRQAAGIYSVQESDPAAFGERASDAARHFRRADAVTEALDMAASILRDDEDSKGVAPAATVKRVVETVRRGEELICWLLDVAGTSLTLPEDEDEALRQALKHLASGGE